MSIASHGDVCDGNVSHCLSRIQGGARRAFVKQELTEPNERFLNTSDRAFMFAWFGSSMLFVSGCFRNPASVTNDIFRYRIPVQLPQRVALLFLLSVVGFGINASHPPLDAYMRAVVTSDDQFAVGLEYAIDSDVATTRHRCGLVTPREWIATRMR